MNVELQVLGSALRAVAEEMGAVLIRSAFSANIKERRDCSTAIFDEAGRMIVQAEHIPVHLGAMPDAVAACLRLGLAPGETAILNDPYTGGTHLPDVTLVSRTALGYAVSRAHHADVGGMEPASLPAFSRELYQEGLILPPTRLSAEVEELFVANARNPDERRGDLRAQIAAHRLAERRLEELCARRGRERVAAAMDELYAYSERMVRAAIARLPDGRWEAEDVVEAVEGELAVRAAVEVAGDEIRIDFAGTAPQDAYNLNCPLSVTKSACYFVVRCLTEPDLPASGGAFAPVTVSAPEGCLVNARPPAAVVAGNTETSSRIVDVVFAALGTAAQGQGTMNNVALGNGRFTYYETIGGGQGGCADADGPSGVHVAMSNTLITPVEALELSYPLRVERWELRLGSGGAGAHRGGDGVVRELRVLEDCRLSVLAERRARAPRGAAGGGDAAPGRTLVNGEEQPAKLTRALRAGDVVRIETPGGGGYGAASDRGIEELFERAAGRLLAEDEEEAREGREAEQDAAQHRKRGLPAGVPLGEDGEDGHIEREDGDQSREARADRARRSAQRDHEHGRDDRARRQIPARTLAPPISTGVSASSRTSVLTGRVLRHALVERGRGDLAGTDVAGGGSVARPRSRPARQDEEATVPVLAGRPDLLGQARAIVHLLEPTPAGAGRARRRRGA